MKKWIILGISILGMFSLTAFTAHSENNETLYTSQSDEVTAIISKNTTEKELKDLQTFFSENGIELILKKVEYNEQNEITSLSIILKRGNSKSQYSSSSSNPISEIELGFKDESLYITQSGSFDIATLGNHHSFHFPKAAMDSLMQKHNFAFNFDFNKDMDSIFSQNNFDITKFKDQIMRSFTFDEDENGTSFSTDSKYLLSKKEKASDIILSTTRILKS